MRSKITFLYKIMDLCMNTSFFGSSRRLIDFCRRYNLVERIQVRGHTVLRGRGKGPQHWHPVRAELGQS